MSALFEARDLTVTMGARTIVSKVNFALQEGEIVTVVGPNGSGKSTLLRALIGALQPSEGTVSRRDGLRIGYVPQGLRLDASMPMSVSRFLNLPRRFSARQQQQSLNDAGAGHLADRQMVDLSGGQFQRVLLARAILQRPHVLMLDEPTTGLDQPGQAAFYKRIEDVRNVLGCAVMMVSHELHVVMSASDRVICMNGHICCEGHPEVVAQAEEYRALFGTGTGGALALYRHEHQHRHDAETGTRPHVHGPGCDCDDPEGTAGNTETRNAG
ncbi:MAG: metal ABC transporter ATP-binding protein [Pelagimonas sp.]|jgi:zinc transport system ATP-binding protein|nr:metal ABC transporter ATP-binding protein [Pelagimonas sp.]